MLPLPLRLRLSLAWQAVFTRAPIGLYTTPPAAGSGGGSFLVGVTDRKSPKRSARQFLEAYSTIPHLRNVNHRIADSVASAMTSGIHLYAVRSRGGRFRRMPELRYASKDVRLKTLKELKAVGELVEIENHPMLDALRGRNNAMFSGYMLHFLNQIYLELLGEAFILKDRGGMRFPVAFYPLPPPWIRETPSATEPFYRLNHEAYHKDIPSEDVMWFKDPDPTNPYGRGSGVAQSLATELDTYEFSSQHIAGWFRNGAIPPAVVAPGDGEAASADQMRSIKQRWIEEVQGFFRKHVPFFSTRKLDVHELAHTFQEQELLELQRHLRDTVLQTENVPPEQVGIIADSNRATSEASSFIFATNVVEPRIERQREYYQEWLVPEYEDPDKLFIWFDSPVPEDKDFTLRAAQAFPWALNSNEARAMMGLDPEEGIPVHMVPFNLVPAETLSTVSPSVRQSLSDDMSAVTTASLEHGPLLREMTSPPRIAKALDDDESYLLIHQVADRVIPRLQRRFYEVMSAARHAVPLDNLAQAITRRQSTRAEEAIGWNTIQESLRVVSSETFLQSIVLSGEGAAEELATQIAASVAFNTASPRVAAYAQSQAALLVTRILETTRQTIREAIARVFTAEFRETAETAARLIRDQVGLLPRQSATLERFRTLLIEQGIEAPQVERRVERLSRAMLRQRSQTIARTEILDAANAGQQMLWEQAAHEGLYDTRRARRFWLLTPDDRLDPHCEEIPERNPEGVALDQPFDTSFGPVMRPTLHQNCRCSVTLRINAV